MNEIPLGENIDSPLLILKSSDIYSSGKELLPGVIILPDEQSDDNTLYWQLCFYLEKRIHPDMDPLKKDYIQAQSDETLRKLEGGETKFFGKRLNKRIVVLPTDTSFLSKKDGNINHSHAITYLQLEDLKSTGKPAVASLKEFTMYIKESSDKKVKFFLAKKASASKESKIIEESRNVWINNARNALGHIYQGGLPTLGKGGR